MKPKTRRIIAIVIVVTALALGVVGLMGQQVQPPPVTSTPTATVDYDAVLRQLFESQTSDVQVQGQRTVTRLLADDLEGSRHQRFILQLASGQTLLMAHNIDLAPRLNGLKEGDKVAFYGEYIYSELGGTIHWTHHDPAGKHVTGWLEWQGQRYQ